MIKHKMIKGALAGCLAVAATGIAPSASAYATTYDDWPTQSLEYHSSDGGGGAYGRIEWDGVAAFDYVTVLDEHADGKAPRVQIQALFNNGATDTKTTQGSETSGYGTVGKVTVGFDAAYYGASTVSYIRHRVCNGGSDSAPANCGSWGGYYQP